MDWGCMLVRWPAGPNTMDFANEIADIGGTSWILNAEAHGTSAGNKNSPYNGCAAPAVLEEKDR